MLNLHKQKNPTTSLASNEEPLMRWPKWQVKGLYV